MTGKKAGVVAKLKERLHTVDGGLGFWPPYCVDILMMVR